MIKALGTAVVGVALSQTPAHAESSETVRLALDGGIGPGLGYAGVDAALVLHPHFEIAATASVTIGASVSAMPRLRFAHGPWRFMAGAGPTASAIVNLSFADDRRGGLVPAFGLAAEASVAYVTRPGLMFQLTGGGGGMIFVDKQTTDRTPLYYPIVNLGVGWAF